MSKPLTTAALLVALLAPLVLQAAAPVARPAPSGDDVWLTDLDAARARAAAEGKDLLVNFTGSDWCHWCVQLHKEVFSRDTFLEPVQEHFVLVELDFPRPGGEAYAAMTKAQHRAAAREQAAFSVNSFPSIHLLTAQGASYAVTGYRQGGPEKYLRHLEKLRTSAERASAARLSEALVDPEAPDAERLEAAYALMGRVSAGLADELITLIERLDPQDSRGVLAPRYLKAFADEHFVQRPDDWHAPRRALADLRERLPSVEQQALYHYYATIVALNLADAARAAGDDAALARERAAAGEGLAAMRRLGGVRKDLLGMLESWHARLEGDAADADGAADQPADADGK